jgi:hypothetical protein
MSRLNKPNVLKSSSGIGAGAARYPLAVQLNVNSLTPLTQRQIRLTLTGSSYVGEEIVDGSTWRVELVKQGGDTWYLYFVASAGPEAGAYQSIFTQRKDLPLDARLVSWTLEDYDPEVRWGWEDEIKLYPVAPGIFPQQII